MTGSRNATATREGAIPTGGVVLVVVGSIFLYATFTDATYGGAMRRLWPLILIAIGVTNLVNARLRDAGAAVLALIGVAMLLFTLDVLSWSEMGDWWPIALIAIGISILLGRRARR